MTRQGLSGLIYFGVMVPVGALAIRWWVRKVEGRRIVALAKLELAAAADRED